MTYLLSILLLVLAWLCGVISGFTTTAMLVCGICKLIGAFHVAFGWGQIIGYPVALWFLTFVLAFVGGILKSISE